MLTAAISDAIILLALAGFGYLGYRAYRNVMRHIDDAVNTMCDAIGDHDKPDPEPQLAVIEADRAGFFAPPPGS